MKLGLFKSIYGRPGEGLYRDLYNMGGQAQPSSLMSHNIRLGQTEEIATNFVKNGKILGVPVWLIGIVLAGLVVLKARKK